MLKILLTTISLLVISTSYVSAGSDLIVSPNSDFSSQKDNFTAGETIYVKVSANSDGSRKKDLNVRDNQYKLLSTYSLNHTGNNNFQTSIPAPANSGYYSLEARIEAEGSVSSSVKTIKVGNASSSSVSVDVDVSSNGQQVLSNTKTANVNVTTSPKSPSPAPSLSPYDEPTTLPGSGLNFQAEKGIFASIKDFFTSIFGSIF